MSYQTTVQMQKRYEPTSSSRDCASTFMTESAVLSVSHLNEGISNFRSLKPYSRHTVKGIVHFEISF